MSLPVVQVDPGSGDALATSSAAASPQKVTGAKIAPVTTDIPFAFGTFKSANITTGTTTEITAPDTGGSIIITDIVIAADKVNNTTLVIQFSDGTDTALIIGPDTVNEAVNFSWSPKGRIQGWKDARIDVITGGAGTPAVTVTVGYIKVPVGISFAEWDALR